MSPHQRDEEDDPLAYHQQYTHPSYHLANHLCIALEEAQVGKEGPYARVEEVCRKGGRYEARYPH